MRKLIWPVFFLLLLLVQGAASIFLTGWLSCDLILVGVYAAAITAGPHTGIFSGVFAGFLQDALTVGVFGYHMLTRTPVGFLAGLTKEKVFKENFTYHICIVGLISVAERFGYWWLELYFSGFSWDLLETYCASGLGFVLGNMLAAYPILKLVDFIYAWIKEEDISY